jgi:nitrogen-specific signal transduction histidine kinase/CheY-like chemotaxis protein
MQVVIQDITEQKRLAEQVRQTAKLESLGILAGGVAHDFNNMLAVIGGYAELLMMNAPPGHSTRGPLEQIKLASDRAAKLTQQLLAFSRKQILQPQVLNLNDVVLGVHRMLRRLIGEDIELVTLGDPAARKIEADPGQIEQVLLNLAVNARDAMPGGGKLTLRTQNLYVDEDQAERLPGARAGAYVLLSVTDTGCGMNAETLERIFEPFYTTKELGKGTGLGLSTVYGIVSQSEGFIEVQSVPEQGTTFRIHFPAVDLPTTPTGSADEDLPQGARSRETVLVVEDEPMVRDLIFRVLETCGYEVQSAMHGDEALRIAEAHPGRIDLLLTDVVMPRMGGRELVERFRELRPETRVLFMSGYTDDALLRHGLAGIEAGFLQKPFSPQVLARTVEELLHP